MTNIEKLTGLKEVSTEEFLNSPEKIITNMKEFLEESPNELNWNYFRSEELDGNNEKEANRIIEKCKLLEIFDYKGIKFRLFEGSELDNIFYYLLHETHPALLFIHQVKKINLLNLIGTESLDIWKNTGLRDSLNKLGRYWIFNYILKNYDFIMSGNVHTKDGKYFWIKLMKKSFENKLNVIVYDIKLKSYEKLINVKNIENYYGNKDKSHYRFIILKKEIQ